MQPKKYMDRFEERKKKPLKKITYHSNYQNETNGITVNKILACLLSSIGRCSIVVSIPTCHAGDLRSISPAAEFFFLPFHFCYPFEITQFLVHP
jgi:hypothetical protein